MALTDKVYMYFIQWCCFIWQLTPSFLSLTEGQEAEMTLLSTLPLVCSNTSYSHCYLTVRYVLDNNSTMPGEDRPSMFLHIIGIPLICIFCSLCRCIIMWLTYSTKLDMVEALPFYSYAGGINKLFPFFRRGTIY